MTLSSTYFTDYMKERWVTPYAIQQALEVSAPLLGLLPKDEDAGGRFMHIPIIERIAGGRSNTYANAVSGSVGSRVEGFDVTYVNKYQIGKLEGNLVRRTKGDKNAIMGALDFEMEACLTSMQKDLRRGIYGNTGGARGVVASISTVYLTLANAQDCINFEPDMEICAASTDGTSGSLRDGGQSITVTKVNRAGNIITADENWSEIASMAANDYLFAAGDFGLDIAGLTGWVPQAAPAATAWFGVDRSVSDRLGGLRYDGRGMPLEDAILNASAIAAQYDGKSDLAVCNTIVWGNVVRSLGADRGNRITSITNEKATVGYSAVMLATEKGLCPLVSDPGCPAGTIFLLDKGSWVIGSVNGPLVQLIEDDGLTIRRGTSDDWTFELVTYGNVGSKAPGKNVNIRIA